MLINIRGTSGSGKSHIARAVMKDLRLKGYSKCDVKEEGRKQPIMHWFTKEGCRPVAFLGHYNTPCGGCDTIPKMERIFNLVRKCHRGGADAVFEGLLISADIQRTLELHEEGLPLLVCELDTPLDVCLESINSRRRARKPDAEDVNPKNTESKHKGVKSSIKKLRSADVECFTGDRDQVLARVLEELQACSK